MIHYASSNSPFCTEKSVNTIFENNYTRNVTDQKDFPVDIETYSNTLLSMSCLNKNANNIYLFIALAQAPTTFLYVVFSFNGIMYKKTFQIVC